MKSLWLPLFRILVTAGALVAAAGCKSTDDEVTERPWNAPKSWETGLPSGLSEGR